MKNENVRDSIGVMMPEVGMRLCFPDRFTNQDGDEDVGQAARPGRYV